MKYKHQLEAREYFGTSLDTGFSKLVYMKQYQRRKMIWHNLICCLVGLVGAALLVLRHKL